MPRTIAADGSDLDLIADGNALLSALEGDRTTLAAHAIRVVDMLFREDDRHLARVMARVVERTKGIRECS